MKTLEVQAASVVACALKIEEMVALLAKEPKRKDVILERCVTLKKIASEIAAMG